MDPAKHTTNVWLMAATLFTEVPLERLLQGLLLKKFTLLLKTMFCQRFHIQGS